MFFPVSTTLASFLTAFSCLKLLRAFITHGYDLRQSALFYTTYCCRIAGDGRGLCNHLIRNSILDLFPPQLDSGMLRCGSYILIQASCLPSSEMRDLLTSSILHTFSWTIFLLSVMSALANCLKCDFPIPFLSEHVLSITSFSYTMLSAIVLSYQNTCFVTLPHWLSDLLNIIRSSSICIRSPRTPNYS